MRKLNLFAALFTLGFAFAAQAHDYGEAGCGLGSTVFNKGENQVLAATTNDSTYTQMFGISSGTSNCTDSGTVRSEARVQLYIDANKQALAKDISRGDGEAIVTLSRLLDCSGQPIGGVLKANYESIFPNSDISTQELSSSIRTILRKNAYQCAHLG